MLARRTIIVSHGRKAASSQTYLPGQAVPDEVARAAVGVTGPGSGILATPKAAPIPQAVPVAAEPVRAAEAKVVEQRASQNAEGPSPQAPDAKAGEETEAADVPTTRKAVLALRKSQAVQLCKDFDIDITPDEKLAGIHERLIRELAIKD